MTPWLVRIGLACYVIPLPEDRVEAERLMAERGGVAYWPCEYEQYGDVRPRGAQKRLEHGHWISA